MTSCFSINFMNPDNGQILGLFDVHLDSPLDVETVEQMRHILFTELHYLLTFYQEGEGQEGIQGEGLMNPETFAEHALQRIRRAIDHVSHLFGEGARVVMDMNLESYEEESCEILLHWRPILSIGAKTSHVPTDPWSFVPFQETHSTVQFLTQANVM
jgi:hypothetical protein